ncbi:MAG: peroxidase [Planctomycetes bacterium]|nr:peroxidase [Planctomycetota bacterium]
MSFLPKWLRQSHHPSAARKLRRLILGLEPLEMRALPSTVFESINGTGNNLANPALGSAGTDLIRIAAAAYADGISAPAGANLPNARLISNVLSDQTDANNPSEDVSTVNQKLLSDYIYVFGQFLDHDLDLTPDSSGIAFEIPPGSATDPMGTEPFTRSVTDPATGTSKSNPLQQINAVTSFLDGSQIYGSSAARADALRTHVGGQLKTGPGDLLPLDNSANFPSGTIAMANDAHIVSDNQLFAAGDVRANENIELTAMQTLFVREHNRIASQLQAAHPGWTDEQLYQEARRLVIAELQMITYTEWLPALLGPIALPSYKGYNSSVNPGIANEFSTAMFRFAHSQLDNEVDRLNNDGSDSAAGAVDLAQAFFNPTLINASGVTDPLSGQASTDIDPILKGAASGNAQEVDLLAVRDIRNFLFGAPGAGGTDLIARDIQRGRDNGLDDYNSMRAAYGLPRVTSFAQITSDVQVQQKLQQLYGTVDKIDAFVGALAEDHVAGADVGPLTKAVLANQFRRLRDGDRFFYLNEKFTPEEQKILQGTTLAKVIERNTGITNLQSNVFFFKASISGTVFAAGATGPKSSPPRGLAGVTVQLQDDEGNGVATALTDSRGRYSFNNFNGIEGTGNYDVRLIVPTGFTQTSGNPATISISRGDVNVSGVNFTVAPTRRNTAPTGRHAAGHDGAIPMTGTLDPAAVDALFAEAAMRRDGHFEM